MLSIRMAVLVGAIAVSVLAGPASEAHTGWSVSGTLHASAMTGDSCKADPVCNAFFVTCNSAAAQWESLDYHLSFRRLPKGVQGHRGRFQWTALSPPQGHTLEPGKVFVWWFTYPSSIQDVAGPIPVNAPMPTCYASAGQVVSASAATTFDVTVPKDGVWLGVSGYLAQELKWTLIGILH